MEKTVHRVETYWLAGKEKVSGAAGPIAIDFLEKVATVNSATYC